MEQRKNHFSLSFQAKTRVELIDRMKARLGHKASLSSALNLDRKRVASEKKCE